MSINLEKYNEAFTQKLDEQLFVYTTIGGKNESPMWFQFKEVNEEKQTLYFQSSQVDYMFFNIPLFDEDKNTYFHFDVVYEYFKKLKYKYIKENWSTVYYELRPNEKTEVSIKEYANKYPIELQTKDLADLCEINTPEYKETDYQQQAVDFLQSTRTTFKSTYKDHKKYFPDDKETRDIYSIVLKNERHRYRFNFGQSIVNIGKHPTAYDVLACVQKYDVGSFDDFCNEFGYDTDSRKAYKIYKSVLREWKNIELLFTPEQIEQLQEIN